MDVKSLMLKNTKKYWYVIAFIIIFLSAFWVRSFPARFNELQAIDPFYVYRMSEYVVNNGFQLPELDMMRHHPFGVNPSLDTPIPYFLPAIMFLFIGPLTGLNYFSYALLYPAIMGAISIIFMFFLGKELFNRNTGLLAAFFLAVIPAFITRTSAGFFDKEASASVFVLMVFYFFVRSYKRGCWKSGILGGISMLLMVQTWAGGVQYMYLLFSLFALILLLLNKDIKKIAFSFIPFAVMSTILTQPLTYHTNLLTLVNILPLAVVGIIAVRFAVEKYKLVKEEYIRYTVPAILVIGILGILFSSMFTDTGIEYLNEIFRIATLQRSVWLSTVAESNPGSWEAIVGVTKPVYGAQVIPLLGFAVDILSITTFMILGMLLIAYKFTKGIFNKDRKIDFLLLFVLLWMISSIWSVLGYIRLLFLLGPPAALVAAYFINSIIEYSKRTKVMQKVSNIKQMINYVFVPMTVFIALVLLMNFANGYGYGMALGPSMNEYWKDSMNFLATETPENSNILSWWDFGYWFQTKGQRPTLTDGGFGKRDEVAWWFTADASNWTGYEPWLKDKYGIDYILMDYTLPAKYAAISKIATDGKQIVGIMQFQQTQVYPQENQTIYEFASGPYALWIPMDSTGSSIRGSPMLLVSQDGQYYSKAYINDICSPAGILTVGNEEQSIGGCVAITSFGVFYVPPEAEHTIFSVLMFAEGTGLPVEKVYDNQIIKIYKVIY